MCGQWMSYYAIDPSGSSSTLSCGATEVAEKPGYTGYLWEGYAGLVKQAEYLYVAGFPAYEIQDRAILRVLQFAESIKWPPVGDDQWLPWILAARYGKAAIPWSLSDGATWGKCGGWSSFTHRLLVR